jgi:asparagine synthase (glutamine-hydrolysing)
MCGITGFFSYKNKIDTKQYYDAHIKIAHRGPDDEGFIYKNSDNNIEHLIGKDSVEEFNNRDDILDKDSSTLILGHRRLSIIDLTYHGHQPFYFDNLYMVYNGEIYNYIELRDELKELGYDFETDTDTEVFLKAYHYWGVESFNKFNGMWATAIFNKENDDIILTRDRFAIKPLYYSCLDDNLIFGSEIKFVSSFIDKLYANEKVVHDYIEYGYIEHTNETFFENILQLDAGHYAIYSAEGLVKHKYYNTKKVNITKPIEQIKDLLFNSIKLRMRSDVEVGSLLSGGMDSSSIVCSVDKKEYAKDMQTFTISYDEKELDYESKYVEDITKQTKFKNNSIHLKPDSDILDKLTYIIESPYRSFSESAMFSIYKHIKENTNIIVLLNGEGSDEIFSGYNAHYIYFLLTLLIRGKIFKFVKELNVIKDRTQRSYKSLIIDIVKVFFIDNKLKKYLKRSKLFNKRYVNNIKKKSTNPFRNEILMNREYSALPEYLIYADKIPMYFSLEVRVPFLDYRLVSTANSLKDDDLIREGVTKYTLREAMKDVVPKSVYERKDKKGFFTPHEYWIKTELSKSIESELNDIKHNNLFSFMNSDEIYKYYGENGINQKVWRLYCLSRWKKVWNICD